MLWSNLADQWAYVGTTWDGFGPLDFPSSPANGDTYRNYVYDSGIGAWRASESINFADISDLNITVLNDKDIIIYDEPSAKWINSSPVLSLSELDDTNITAPSDGEALLYDSASQKWINSAINLTDPIKLNEQVITENYTIPVGYNGLSAGPITIASGVTVTIPTGSAWSIV